jgi:predicted ATPase
VARRITSPVFVGRRPELDRLGSALSDAVAGRPSAVLLAGDAGVGKTRLVAEFSARATSSGARVLAGGCVPVGEAGLPFAAVVEMLRRLVQTVGRPAFETLAGRGRGDLARLVPDLGPVALAASDPSADPWAQARIFELLLGLLGRLADQSPVVFVIEDLHWADEATRGLSPISSTISPPSAFAPHDVPQ